MDENLKLRNYTNSSAASFTNLLVAIAAAALLLSVVGPPVVRTVEDFRVACAVGYAGTGLNLGFEGWRAGAECRRFTESSPALVETAASGPILCRAQDHSITQTVRDSSQSRWAGRLVCAAISRDQAPGRLS